MIARAGTQEYQILSFCRTEYWRKLVAAKSQEDFHVVMSTVEKDIEVLKIY